MLALNGYKRRFVDQEYAMKTKDLEFIQKLFANVKLNSNKKIKISILPEEEKLNKGIEKTVIKTGVINDNEETIEDDEIIDINELLYPTCVLVSLLTIYNKNSINLIDMYNEIKLKDKKKNILYNQIRMWWSQKISDEEIDRIMIIFSAICLEVPENMQTLRQIKELLVKNIKNTKELSQLIDTLLIPQVNEKENHAEISSPYFLRQDMLDMLPAWLWSNSNHRFFEPCCGKSGFNIDIIDRLMKGLEKIIPDEEQRYKHIVTKMLFIADINPLNIFIAKLLIDPLNKYDLNLYEGNTLELDLQEQFKIDGFHAIIGNPPYNAAQMHDGKKGGGHLIWNKFIIKSLDEWLLPDGHLLFVNPAAWRKPQSDRAKTAGLYKKMTQDNQLITLEIHDAQDGLKTFKCGTRYDFYLIQKKPRYSTTKIISQGKTSTIDTAQWSFIPNTDFIEILSLLNNGGEDCPIICSTSAYETRKKWISEQKSDIHRYPVLHGAGLDEKYSSRNDRGHFDIPKVIFGDAGPKIKNVMIDMEGIYGMTQHAMAIQIDSRLEAEQLKKAILSDKFKDILTACSWSNFQVDWRLFTYLKKDFYKEHIFN